MKTRLKNSDMLKLPLQVGEHYHAIHTSDAVVNAMSYRFAQDALEVVRKWAGAALICNLKLEQEEDGFKVSLPQAGHVSYLYVEACNDFTCQEPIG